MTININNSNNHNINNSNNHNINNSNNHNNNSNNHNINNSNNNNFISIIIFTIHIIVPFKYKLIINNVNILWFCYP